MLKPRVIPVLLVRDGKLVKTIRFKNDQYIGDPINAIKIFSEKDVDELIILDISANRYVHGPNFYFLEKALSQCFMPITYGGGIASMEDVNRIISLGAEKVILNTTFFDDINLVKKIVQAFGSQAVSVSLDVRKKLWGGYAFYSNSGTRKIPVGINEIMQCIEMSGVGEIFINNIDREGTMTGFDTRLINLISSKTHLPVVVCGGARSVDDFQIAIDLGAHSVAAGSMFVFQGQHKAVLIQYTSL